MDIENIYNEEMKLTVKNLLTQTEKGSITWKCSEYIPASFMLRDELEDTSTDYIGHMATFVHEVPGWRFELEVDGNIEFNETESGLLSPKLSICGEDWRLISQVETVIDGESSEDEYGFIPLCNAIYKRADEWLEQDFFTYMDERSFYPQKGVTKKHREQPLCRLMERLMHERRVEDFHKMILDKTFRKQLLDTI